MFDFLKTGAEIKRLRKSVGVTQGELAEKLIVSTQAVSNWERGVSPPDIDNLIALSEYFGVKIDNLINPVSEKCFVAIDGGGTKTEAILFTREGRVLNRVMVGASNPNDIGMEKSCTLLLDCIKKLTLKSPVPEAVYIGIAGAGGAYDGSIGKAISGYIKENAKIKKVIATSDVFNLFALDESAEIIAISGTGVVVSAKNISVAVGGNGYMLDRGGSGYNVGADALSASFDYEDGISEYTLIRDLIIRDKKIEKAKKLVFEVYEKGKKFVASFAPFVIQAYKAGDGKAQEILTRNMEHLGKMITRAVEKSGKERVLLSGGFINNNRETLLPLLKKFVSAKAQLIFSDFPPVFGACKECLKLAGVEPKQEFEKNFKETYAVFKE